MVLVFAYLRPLNLYPKAISNQTVMQQKIRREDALDYHAKGRPGKLTKKVNTNVMNRYTTGMICRTPI